MAKCKYCKQRGKWLKVDGRWRLITNGIPHTCTQYKTKGMCPKCYMMYEYEGGERKPHVCKVIHEKRIRRSKNEVKIDKLYRAPIHLENEDQIYRIFKNEPLI